MKCQVCDERAIWVLRCARRYSAASCLNHLGIVAGMSALTWKVYRLEVEAIDDEGSLA